MTVLHDKDERIFAYDFDGDGNRISQSLNDCLETRFVYDGPNVILDLSAGGGSADGGNGSNELVHAYMNGLGIDQPIERIGFINGAERTRLVYHADALGSIASLTDESGATVKTYAYEAFGKIRTESQGLIVNRIGFTAREMMGDSLGLYYYRNRVMDGGTGRFISLDPLGFVDGPNQYSYCDNDPLGMVDPLGMLSDNEGGGRPPTCYTKKDIPSAIKNQLPKSVQDTLDACCIGPCCPGILWGDKGYEGSCLKCSWSF